MRFDEEEGGKGSDDGEGGGGGTLERQRGLISAFDVCLPSDSSVTGCSHLKKPPYDVGFNSQEPPRRDGGDSAHRVTLTIRHRSVTVEV